MAGNAEIFFNLDACPGFCKEFLFEFLLVSSIPVRGEHEQYHDREEQVSHYFLPQYKSTTHMMSRNRKAPRKTGRFRTFFSFWISRNGHRRKTKTRINCSMIPKNLFGIILRS